MKRIKLTQGKFALVDDGDFKKVNQFKWFTVKGNGDTWYARRTGWDKEKKIRLTISMHRFILNARPGTEIDHEDLNGLNNQKSNLRFCSNMQQSANRKAYKNSKTKIKGVIWHKRDKIFEAAIRVNWKLIYLGRFHDKMEAAKAYDRAAIKYFGSFSKGNFTHA